MTTSNGDLNWIANYIWGIADDVLRDLYVRGKYRDVILPMTVLRRLDAVLEGSKQAVLDMKASLDGAGVVEQDPVQDILDLSRPCDYPDARKRWSWAALWRRTLAAGHGAAGRDNHRPSRKASSRSGGRNRPTLVVGGVVRASARSLILMSACK